MRDQALRILRHEALPNRRGEASPFIELALLAPGFEAAAPGQFANLLVAEEGGPVLRKPLSVYDDSNNVLRFLYRAVGPGTRALALRRAGEELRVLGPLGTPFPEPTGPALLVGGGVGIPPLAFFGRKWGAGREVISVLGFRNVDEVTLEDEFASFSDHVLVATDDGSYGVRGTVMDALARLSWDTAPPTLYACGPGPMLRALKTWAAEKGVTAYLSVEEYMGCGYGVCLSCAVKRQGEYVRACTEGPVFKADEIEV